MKTISSTLGNIYLGPVHDGLASWIDQLEYSGIFILADENTSVHCAPFLSGIISPRSTIVLPAGERFKNLESCKVIWSAFIQHGADRDSVLLNVGGGMICDIGGFAASCYQRGIRFINLPTTVLAMADAAIGGKTGIDFEGLKNYLGTIKAPVFTWIDTAFLATLPEAEKTAGLSEIVKHAIIGSRELWDLLNELTPGEPIPWQDIFEKNLPVKLKVVENDPFEKGIRKILNFGHTIGHALESFLLANSVQVTHGQCVATGMLVEAKISNSIGLLNNEDFNAIVNLVETLLEPIKNSLPNFEALDEWMIRDKKKKNDQIGFSLPDRIGSCGWNIPVEKQVIANSFHWLTQAKVFS